ncbi:uncharacterized protein LOC127841074 isoform X2 [Dreissena polymorpha]|uniref:uncharacterized protein LOC127841074 isoform X2 n=1 Tax=Dreissena polymorpha TaxID=45954 RepID=UPI0022652E51|nr:uncharacterized protein LOC127841074 isoform X2 [Dreissena polymorpha]
MGQRKRKQKQRQKPKEAVSGDQQSESNNGESTSLFETKGQSSTEKVPPEPQSALSVTEQCEGGLEVKPCLPVGNDTSGMQTYNDKNSSDESASSVQEATDEWPSLESSTKRDTGARPKTYDSTVWKVKGNRKPDVNIYGNSNVQIGDGQNIIQMNSYTDAVVPTQVTINFQEKGTLPSSKMAVMNKFRESMRHFKTGHFILVTDEVEFVQNIDCLGFVKWLVVFDFDKRGWETGLLSRVKSRLQQSAFLNHICWQDTKFSVSNENITWISLTGISDRPDTILDDLNQWKRKVRLNLTQQINQIKKFCELSTILSVLVVWPEMSTKYGHFRIVIETIQENLDDVAIVVAVPSNVHNADDANLKLLEEENENCTVLQIDLQEICKIIQSECATQTVSNHTQYMLPTSDGFNLPGITDAEAHWLREDLDVLYFENNEEYTIENLQEEEQMFYKGGTLSWSARYAGRSTHADIERDFHKQIVSKIKVRHIQVCKAGIIKLCHNPGSGGTTLAQRVVWDLKQETPCAQVKHRFGSTLQDICEKIELLHDKTQLPIIVLLDGEEEQRVESIFSSVRDRVCIIVLYVQRYYTYIDRNYEEIISNKMSFFLQNHVSCLEADLFARQYRKDQKLSPLQEKKLKQLVARCRTENVKKQKKISVFELGLEIHDYQYNGLCKYIKGYLQLDKMSELQSWHKVLAYLSLVYFFGQSSLPCRLFADLPAMQNIYRIEDFPMEMKDLVVPDINDIKPNMVRISHYLVAKEILNQLLPHPKIVNEFYPQQLSEDAKRNLEKISVEFIEFGSRRASEDHSSSLICIMTKTFIDRTNKQVCENEAFESKTRKTQESKHRKTNLAPIIELASDKPPYTERFRIYQQLTESFPKEAQFKAHLGRLYSLCRPEEVKQAEKYLSEALDDSLAEIEGFDEDDIPYTKKLDLMHIYHMFGSVIKRNLSKYTGKTEGGSKKIDFARLSKVLLHDIKRACTYFTESRKMTPLGSEKCYSYVSEIHVRLTFCDFVNKNSGYTNLFEFLDNNDSEAADFVRDSCVIMDELFVECFSVIELERMDYSIGNCQEWYSALFQCIPGHFIPNIGDGVQSRRLEIARIKMQYCEPDTYGVLELITNANDIQQIAKRYEMNIIEYENQGVLHVSKRQMNMDYMEWMYVIRHKLYEQECKIDHVLQKVEKWHELLHSPQSRFYLFVLHSLLGFGTDGDGSHSLLIAAKNLKEEVVKFSKYVAKPRYPREWLGLPRDDIRRLYPGLRFFRRIEGRKIPTDLLEIRKGKILPPNDKPSGGFIALDLGPNNRVPINVFYIPARTEGLKGTLNSGIRVEFVLGFSMSHGYEAFNVKRLETVQCPRCKIAIEKRSNETSVTCQKCTMTFSVKRPRYL